jgi:hypothetical protein
MNNEEGGTAGNAEAAAVDRSKYSIQIPLPPMMMLAVPNKMPWKS